MIGTSWVSIDGKKEVVGMQGDRLLVHTEGQPKHFCTLIPQNQLAREIELDTSRLPRKKEQVVELIDVHDDGFTKGMSPRQAALVDKVLNTQRAVSGVFKSARQHIQDLTAKGYRVDEKHNLVGPTGSFYTEKDLGKTLIAYALYLTTNKNPTPLLRDLKHQAYRAVREVGKKEAYQDTLKMVGQYDRMKQPELVRRYLLVARLIKKSAAKKKIVRKSMYDKLIEEYGTTNPMEARGFILANGECLNLGQYDDHRIINSVYPDSQKAEKTYGSRYGAFRHLCELYNMIRWVPESRMCEVFVEPTRQQISVMRELAENEMLNEIEVHHRGKSAVLEAQDADTLVSGVEAVYGS